MSKLSTLSLLASLVLAATLGCAHAQIIGAGVHGVEPAGGGGSCSYTGEGDVVSGAAGWWGLRAYSAATCGNVAINACTSGDAACGDISTSSSDGTLDTGFGATDCSSVTCTVKIIYDQSGGSLDDLVQNTESLRATLSYSTTTCTGGVAPCLVATRIAGTYYVSNTAFSQTQPFSTTAVAIRTGSQTSINNIFSRNSGKPFIRFQAAADKVQFSAGTIYSAGANENVWHFFGASFEGTSSNIQFDANNGNTDLGTNDYGSGQAVNFCGAVTNSLDGACTEGGFWASSLTLTQLDNLRSNAETFWGY